MLDDGLAVLTGLLSGEPMSHEGPHYVTLGARFLPAPRVPICLAGRFPNAAPLRRATAYDGFVVIGLDRGASWVLTRVGPYDLDLTEVERLVDAGP